MKSIGYIGLGIMGSAMAGHLLRRGFELSVWNRTRVKAEPLLQAGAVWGESPAQLAAQTELVCLNVTDTADVEAVLFGKNGVAEGGRPGLVVVDHSTISPQATREFAARLLEKGIAFLDAPVTGGDVGAREGTLSIMVGGDIDVFERSRKVLEAMGRRIIWVGPSGQGQLCKACNQILCALNLMGVCEAMALAHKEGLDLDKMLEVTTAGAGGSWALEHLGRQIAEGAMDPGFMIDLINKDLGIVKAEAESQQLPLLGTRLVAELFQAAAGMGHGRAGTQALSKVLEAIGQFQFKGSPEPSGG